MKTIFKLFILSFLFQNIIYGQNNKYELILMVKNIRNNKGLVALQLLNEKEQVVEALYISIKDKVATTVFNNLSPGKYAIRVYHDENRNKKMDFNWMGIPKEGYGFSGNPKITFGPPDFEKFLFQIDADKKIIINMIYFL
jgi:uncharacterized protein (DUF2141 family)